MVVTVPDGRIAALDWRVVKNTINIYGFSIQERMYLRKFRLILMTAVILHQIEAIPKHHG
jgi:hypothetical protein